MDTGTQNQTRRLMLIWRRTDALKYRGAGRTQYFYDPETGEVFKVKRPKHDNCQYNIGSYYNVNVTEMLPVHRAATGHQVISVTSKQPGKNGSKFAAKIIWEAVHNTKLLGMEVQHVNGDPRDDRLVNLRAVTSNKIFKDTGILEGEALAKLEEVVCASN